MNDPASLVNRLESIARWDASEQARDLPGFTVEMSAAWQAAQLLKMLDEMTCQPKPKDFTFWAIKPGFRKKFCEMMILFKGPAESFLPAFLR